MALHIDGPPTDPATDDRADYDYAGGGVKRPDLVADLRERIDGDVRFDGYTRQLYATDASIYERTPVGVVFPTSTADVSAVVEYCASRAIPVLPRGGGTSLAGQAVNRAVVLDFTRHMTDLRNVDPEGRTATAEAGIYLGDMNAALADHNLKFAPDPAWGDKSALGGAIGNNSTGSHSLVYGKTDYYVEAVEAVLADGTVTRFGEVAVAELRERADPDADAWGPDGPESDLLPRIYAEVVRILDEEGDEVAERYPDLKRNVSGYNLDTLVDEARGRRRTADDSGIAPDSEPGTVNLARLLAGSEGTLAVVTEATVSLAPVPETKAVALLTYDDLLDAMEDVAPILEHDPCAVEVMDDVLLGLARETAEFREVVGLLPEGTDSVLLVEFYAGSDDEGRRKVADLVADRVGDGATEADPNDGASERTDAPRRARHAMEAHDAETRGKFWKMRKSGLPILLSRTSDRKHVAYIEDTAIPAENLPEYVADFQDVLEEYDTTTSYYAHAGPGVLHIRPLVNTKTVEGVEQLAGIADAVTDLVVEYGGSVSGEHGDGRARTQWNRKLYGDRLWRTFRGLKSAYDPDWLLNPGNVCGLAPDERVEEGDGDGDGGTADRESVPAGSRGRGRGPVPAHDMTEHLRFDPDYEFDAGFAPELNWENENGFQGMAELCHGCGGCRGKQETTGGVMCPTFRAANEEALSTRGRANMLRQAMSGDLPEDEAFSDEFVTEVLDLCIGCKGCARDCPSEVDLAKLKAELEHQHHQRHGASLRDRAFARIGTLSKLGSLFAPLSNAATELPGARTLLERTGGIARERSLPTFHRRSFADWFEQRGGAAASERRARTARAERGGGRGAGTGVTGSDADRKALLFPDTYTNYNHPRAGRAAVYVLESAGVRVGIPDGVTDSGRPAHSKGFLDRARAAARTNVDALAPRIENGWDVVVVEPSDAVMLQSDYLDLLDGDDAERVADATYGVMEYLDTFRLDERLPGAAGDDRGGLTYHGHCHQKATAKDHHAVGVLRRAGYDVDPLDSTCCGMAGSFGYEAEHYSMSRAIGSILFEQVADSPGEAVVAPGASCRTQLGDRDADAAEPPHPVEKLAATLID